MKEEFVLSAKKNIVENLYDASSLANTSNKEYNWYWEEDIKEFIKQLKIQLYVDPEPCCFGIKEKEAFDIINRLAGDKLIEEGK